MRLDFQSQWGRALRTCSMILLSATLIVGCTEDGVTLPDEYNTQRFREIVIDTQSRSTWSRRGERLTDAFWWFPAGP